MLDCQMKRYPDMCMHACKIRRRRVHFHEPDVCGREHPGDGSAIAVDNEALWIRPTVFIKVNKGFIFFVYVR